MEPERRVDQEHVAAGAVRPGALTALLAELVEAPAGAGWEVPLLAGDTVGRFEIMREIGRGGFGVVYEARDVELGRIVAFKAVRCFDSALRAPLSTNGGTNAVSTRGGSNAVSTSGESNAVSTNGGSNAVAQLAEAEAAARLAHPNIVHLYDVGRCEQGAYLILELLRGQPLSGWVGQRVPVRDVVRAGVEIARGLAHAHAHGVVHRDLKPGNVFVCEDGQVKVLDFGLAHVFGRGAVEGGTPAYMAPEQARGEVGDERSDLYSLGVILDHLLASPVRRRVPSALTKLVARLRAADPAARPVNAKTVLDQLTAIQRSLEPKRFLWATVAVAAIAIVAAVGLALRSRPLPPGRLLVAMADIDNASGDAALDDVSTLLGSALEQSRRLSLMTRGRIRGMLREAGRPIPSRLGESTVREVAVAAAANVLLVPAARRFGEGYELEVRGVDLRRNEPLFTIRERAGGKPAVPDALDRVSDRVRRELREDSEGAVPARVRLAEIVPSDPDAWRHYAEGMRLDSEGQGREAVAAYERALKVDPGFPLAHMKLAGRTKWFDDETSQRHFDAAMRHADRLPPKERILLEANRFYAEERIEEAVAAWDRAIAGWPQDQEAYKRAGFTLLAFYSDAQAARPYLEKALELAALNPGAAVDALMELGRPDEALRRAQRWVDESPSPVSLATLSEVYRRRGEPALALEAARRTMAEGGRPGTATFTLVPSAFWSYVEADALDELEELDRRQGSRSFELPALGGRLREAVRRHDAQWKPSPEEPREDATTERAIHHAMRGELMWGTGDADAVWHEVEQQLLLGSAVSACSARLLASLGDLRRAARLASLWAGWTNSKTYCSRLYRHVRDWKRGDRAGAEAGLATMYGPEPAYHRGMILAELGRHREAVESFRKLRREPEWNYAGANLNAYPRSLYFEAVSLEHLGERAEAARVLDRLLRMWRNADPDLPYLAEAREQRRRLAVSDR